MGNESYPVRRGTIGPGAPTKYDHQQIAAKIKAASSGELHNLSSTYATLERLLAQARSDLAFHRGRLKAAWPQGPSADAALAEIKRLEQAAGELAEASGEFRTALMAAGRTVDTYKATDLSAATGALGTVPDPKQDLLMEKLAKDREAQRHMDQMNKGLISAYANIPSSVSMDLPGRERDAVISDGGTGSGSSDGLGGGATRSGTPGITQPPGEPAGHIPPSMHGAGPSPQGSVTPGLMDLGGETDLESTTPSGAGTPSGNSGQSPVGGPTPPGNSGPGGGAVVGPVATGVGGFKPGSVSPRPGATIGLGALGTGAGSSRPGVIGGPSATPRLGPQGFGVTGQHPGAAPRGLAGTGGIGVSGIIGRPPTGSAVADSGRGRGRTSNTGGPGASMLGQGRQGSTRASSSERHGVYVESEDLWTDDDDTVPPVIR